MKLDDAFIDLENFPETSDSYIQSLLVTADLYQVLGIPAVSESEIKKQPILCQKSR